MTYHYASCTVSHQPPALLTGDAHLFSLQRLSSIKTLELRYVNKSELREELASPFITGVTDDIGTLLDDNSAVHKYDLIGYVSRESHLVGNDNHSHLLLGKFSYDLEHSRSKFGIQSRRGLVKEKDLRVYRHRPRDRYSLLLSSRQVTGERIRLARQVELRKKTVADGISLLTALLVHVDESFRDVTSYREVRKEIEVLEHETELASYLLKLLLVGVMCKARVRSGNKSLTCNDDTAGIDLFERGGTAKKRRLTAARRSDDRHYFALLNLKIDTLKHLKGVE